MYYKNNNLQILGPDGFKPFAGIQRVTKTGRITITLNGGTELKCALSHQVKTQLGWKSAKDLKLSDIIFLNNDSNNSDGIYWIDYEEGEFDYYDLVEVENHEYYTNDIISHNCDFLGSMSTLIDGKKIGAIPTMNPIAQLENDALWIYEKAKPGRRYCMTVDTSHGKELDYSAFVVIDITEIPYKLVAKYRSNSIPSVFYPEVIYRVAKTYNDAFVLVESNDVGLSVVQTLFMDLEYEHIFISETKQSGQMIGGMMSGTNKTLGLRMSTATKRIGCMQVKTLIEMDRLIVNDFHIKSEMSTFVAQKNSYAAEVGKNDDLMMCLVMFAWLSHQPYFKDLADSDVRKHLLEQNDSLVNEDLIPFGFISGGHEFHGSYVDDDYFEPM